MSCMSVSCMSVSHLHECISTITLLTTEFVTFSSQAFCPCDIRENREGDGSVCRSNRQYLVIVHFICLVLSILILFLSTYNCEWDCDVCELDVSD